MGMLSRIRYTLWTPTLLLQDAQTGECLWHTPYLRRAAEALWSVVKSGKGLAYAIITGLAGGAGWRLADYLLREI